MKGIIDADTHISEGAAMWALMDQAMQPRRPIMLQVPEDTWYGNRNAFWLIDGEIFPKPAGKGSFALVTPSEQKVQAGRKDSTPATREMTDIKGRLADMEKLNTAMQIVYPTLFLVYNTKDKELEVALCRAYNRYLAQACAQSGGLMKWVVVLPLQSMHAAIDEIRFAKQNGAVGVFFRGIEGEYTLDHPYPFPGLRGSAETQFVDLRAHWLRREADSRNVRFGAQPYIRSHAGDATVGISRSGRQQDSRAVSRFAFRFCRSSGGMGAVSYSHHSPGAQRTV